MDLPGLAGSDAHRPDELWTVYTELEASPTVRDILMAIQKGKVKVARSGKSIPF
ncbi:MAG: PHP-associated domain-containing protein [Thermoproteota archaeon]